MLVDLGLGRSISTSTGPSTQTPVSVGAGYASISGSSPSAQGKSTDALTRELVQTQNSLASFAALVADKAPAAKDPVNDAQSHISTVVANIMALPTENAGSRKAFLDAQIKISISLSRVALSGGFSWGGVKVHGRLTQTGRTGPLVGSTKCLNEMT
jgi:hypothetical protein